MNEFRKVLTEVQNQFNLCSVGQDPLFRYTIDVIVSAVSSVNGYCQYKEQSSIRRLERHGDSFP